MAMSGLIGGARLGTLEFCDIADAAEWKFRGHERLLTGIRATRLGEQFGQVTPSLVQYTTDVLFRDLWLRPELAPRDRSLVTVSALVATGQVAQITYHLNRAMDNGLTQEQAGEVITHLAFYAGWPNAFSALPVAKEVSAKRAGAGANR